jgi:hypothetical protein
VTTSDNPSDGVRRDLASARLDLRAATPRPGVSERTLRRRIGLGGLRKRPGLGGHIDVWLAAPLPDDPSDGVRQAREQERAITLARENGELRARLERLERPAASDRSIGQDAGEEELV